MNRSACAVDLRTYRAALVECRSGFDRICPRAFMEPHAVGLMQQVSSFMRSGAASLWEGCWEQISEELAVESINEAYDAELDEQNPSIADLLQLLDRLIRGRLAGIERAGDVTVSIRGDWLDLIEEVGSIISDERSCVLALEATAPELLWELFCRATQRGVDWVYPPPLFHAVDTDGSARLPEVRAALIGRLAVVARLDDDQWSAMTPPVVEEVRLLTDEFNRFIC